MAERIDRDELIKSLEFLGECKTNDPDGACRLALDLLLAYINDAGIRSSFELVCSNAKLRKRADIVPLR